MPFSPARFYPTKSFAHILMAFIVALLAPVSEGAAQGVRDAVVATSGPVFLLPDATRTPLATLPAGTRVAVRQVQGEWVQVTFPDVALGPRTGWIRRDLLTLSPTTPPEPPPEPRPGQPAAKPRPRTTAAARVDARPSARILGSAAFTRMAASQSFEAVTGSANVPSYGGGVQFVNLWRGLFAEVALDRSSLDGERVFVFQDEVFRLGIPVEVTTTGLDVVGGWRMALRGRLTPYAGAGVTFARYRETSAFADTDENVNERSQGVVALGGLEVAVARRVRLAAEARYRRVPNILGGAGISADYGERSLGGLGAVVRVVLGR